MRAIILFLLWTALLNVPKASAQSRRYSPQVGQKHLPFTLPSIQDGKSLSLAQFRGKKVLLIQFASW